MRQKSSPVFCLGLRDAKVKHPLPHHVIHFHTEANKSLVQSALENSDRQRILSE